MAKIDYPAILDEAYQQMIAPRADNAPTVISTFAGGGGSSAGYHMAGYRELLAVEWDDNAVETLRLNFPGLDIYHGDIAKLSVDEVLRRTGLQPGELDVLDGSPPCQGFSTAGKRVFDDDRNQLFREYVRLLRGLRPKVFVMENVSGMVKGKMKLLFVEILKELKASGYMVSARMLNAMYFHVPQSRQRMIFIGVRDDLGIEPSHPKAESRPIGIKGLLDYQGRVVPQKSAKRILNHHLYRPLNLDRPSPTFTKRYGNLGNDKQYIPKDGRLIQFSVGEAKRIGSFPAGYVLSGNERMIFSRIGNSVPPLFMRAIARHIRSEILNKTPELIEAQP